MMASPEIEERPIFRPFTRESLSELTSRIQEIKTKRKQIEIQTGISDDAENVTANPQLEAFKTLPKPFQRKFPKVLTATPIEEIDNYYTEVGISTFVVISKSNDIWRFNTASSLYMLSPFHPLRRVAIYILTHPYFSFFVIATILTNCIIMTLPYSKSVENTEIIFTTIYSFESCLKIIARGFIIHKFTYLRDGWNWLDFMVILVAYLTMIVDSLANLSALRTFRVLRALKTVAIIPGLKMIVAAVIESVKNLKDVIVLTCFSLAIFALLGQQIYSGVLTQICMEKGPDNMTKLEWHNWYGNKSHWIVSGDEQQNLCSNSTEGQRCKDSNHICLASFNTNPNFGYTNFDSFNYALLSTFRLLTQDSWETLYFMIIRATGYWHIIFFIAAIFFGSIYLVNLILAIVAMSYNELRKKMKKEEEAVQAEETAYQESLKLEEQHEKNSTPVTNGNQKVADLSSQLYTLHSGPDLSLTVPTRRLKPLMRAASTGDYEDNRINCERDVKYLDSFSLPDATAGDNYDQNQSHNETVISGWNKRNNLQMFCHYQSDSQRLSVTNARRRNSVRCLHGLYSSKEEKDANDVHSKFNGITDMDNPFLLQPSELNKLRRKSGTMLNGQLKQDKTDHKTSMKEKLKKNMNHAVDILCVWDCCWGWVWVQKLFSNIVFDPFMELFITICIVVNTLFMAIDHYGISPELDKFLDNGNTFFTTAFTLEAALKLIALNPKFYFREGWNCFDFLIVSLSLMEKAFEKENSLSVLRTFRLLRVFKLAKSWPTLNLLISIMGKTLGSLGNLTLVLIIIMFIFAVMGNQLFARPYEKGVEKFADKKLPRWNFKDFLHSFMVVFRVLCGEWIELMWDCVHVADWTCIPFFLAAVIIGNLVVLRLFLALLLSSFGASNLSSPTSENTDTKKLQEAFERFSRAYKWIKNRVRVFLKILCCRMRNRISDTYSESQKTLNEIVTVIPEGKNMEILVDQIDDTISEQPKIRFQSVANNILQSVKLRQAIKHAQLQRERTFDSSSVHSNMEANENVYEADQTSEEIRAENMETVSADIFNEYPNDCFSERFYRRFPFCNGETGFWVKWKDLRYKCYYLIENKYFESIIIILILISSMTLALEDANLDQKAWLKELLRHVDKIFTFIFFCEMVLKWFGYGFRYYFTNGWCWLDFLIVMVSVINAIAELFGKQSIQAFKTMKTLRALRPLRAMSRMQGMRVVVNALIQAIPAIFNVMLVCLILWLIFAIMGVQFFKGKFGYCRDKSNLTVINSSIVRNKTECNTTDLGAEVEWYNPSINFDNVLNGYLALLQVATFKGWTMIIQSAVDSPNSIGQQPKEEVNIYMYAYFVLFIFCGSFFTLNLFIGVIIDNFNEQKKKAGGALEMLMTKEQKKYYSAMKKIGKRKPIKAIPRPRLKFQALLFDITTNKKFDMTIMVIILLNMVVMCLDIYNAPSSYTETLELLNLIFIGIFTVECLLKLFALRWHYFKEPWNIFDFVIVLLSIAGSILKEWSSRYFVSPTMLRVVRVVKIGRVLRLVKSARGIRTLLFALAMSLPALFNICLLLFLVTFIYAIFGMSFFMKVKKRSSIDDTFNFDTFFKSFVVLFPMCTSSGWDRVLAAISDETNCTKSGFENATDLCGNKSLATGYLITYLIITFFVIINMYIAVILENYSQAKDDVLQGLTNDDYDMFYEVWSRYDPFGTRFIHVSMLSDLFDNLEAPLKISKPNKYIIVSMDIPICANDLCYCVEVLDALTKYFFANKGVIIEESPKLMPFYEDREHVSSTMWRQREIYCAVIVQKAWNKWKRCLQH